MALPSTNVISVTAFAASTAVTVARTDRAFAPCTFNVFGEPARLMKVGSTR